MPVKNAKKPWEKTQSTRAYEGKYELTNMWENHHEIKRLTLLGLKPKDISAKVGLTRQVVDLIINTDVFQQELSILSALRDEETVDIAIEIREKAPKCLRLLDQVVSGTLESSSVAPSLRVNVAKDLLDRGGFAAPKVIRTEGFHAHYTRDDIEKIKERAEADGLIDQSGFTEAEFIEITAKEDTINAQAK